MSKPESVFVVMAGDSMVVGAALRVVERNDDNPHQPYRYHPDGTWIASTHTSKPDVWLEGVNLYA